MNLYELLHRGDDRVRVVHHHRAVTALQTAEAAHVKGGQLVKAVLVNADQGYLVALIPADRQVDLAALESLVGAHWCHLASEEEIAKMFNDVEPGIVPPFGSLYGLRTVLDIHLAASRELVFKGATHQEVFNMSVEDFELQEHPIMGVVSTKTSPEGVSHADA